MILPIYRARIAGFGACASVAAVLALFFSCDRFTPLPKSPPSVAALAPSSDELYLFPYGRLSLSAFEVLRREYPGVRSADLARIAMASQWLITKSDPGKSATLQETTRCVRALYPPEVSSSERSAAILFARDRLGTASLDLLRQAIHDAAGGWVVEWNPSLAREYGIQISAP